MSSVARWDRWWAIVPSVLLVAMVGIIGPALANPGDRVAGGRGDSAAEVWWLNEMASDRVGIVAPTTTPTVNVPDGFRVRRPVEVSTLLVDLAAWPLYQLLGPAAVRNALLAIAVLLNGWAMWVAGRAAGLARAPCLVGAVVFMYAPPVLFEVQTHLALVAVFPLPLAFAAVLSLGEQRSLRRAVLLGAVVGGSCYLNPYIPLYTAVVAVSGSAVVLARHGRAAMRAVAVAAGVAIAMAFPALVVLRSDGGGAVAALDRAVSDLDVYSMSLHQMLQANGPVAVGLVIGVAGGLGLWMARGAGVAATALLLAVGGALLAAGSHVGAFGWSVPGPSRVLFDVFPAWRVTGRAFVLVWFAVALGIAHLVATWREVPLRRASTALAGAALLLVVGFSFRDGRPWIRANETPQLAEFLRERQGNVAEYPLFGLNNDALGPYLLRQVFHGRPLVNGALPGTVSEEIAAAVGDLDDVQASAGLALGGVRTLVVHDDRPVPVGTFIGEYNGARVFDIESGRPVAIASWRDAYDPEKAGGIRWQWLTEASSLRVASTDAGRYLVQMLLSPAPGVAELRFVGHTVPIGPDEHWIQVCVETVHDDETGLARGSLALSGDTNVARLGEQDPRRSPARARSIDVVGRCD